MVQALYGLVRLFVKMSTSSSDSNAKLVSRTAARHAPRRSMKFVNTHTRTRSNAAAIGLLSILTIVSFSSTALATPKEKRTWSSQYTRAANSPSNCPTEAYLRTSLAANLDGQDPFEKDASRSISVTIEQVSNEVEARITVRDENGTVINNNTLHAPSWRCDQLAERIVFALQDIVDPLELPQVKTADTPNAPQVPTINPPKKEPKPASVVKPVILPQRSSIIPKLVLSFGVGPAWWNAPQTALSTTIGVEASWKRTAMAIEGHYDYAWTVPSLHDSRAERATVMVMACVLHRWSARFMMRGCGFGDFGKTSVEIQKDESPNQYTPVADIGARMGAAVWFLPNFGIELRADAAYAIARPQVRMLDNRIWRAAPFTGAVRVAFLGAFDIL